MHELDAPPLQASVWADDGIAIASLRYDGVEVLGRPGPRDIFGRDDVALGMPLLAPWANRLAVDQYVIGTHTADVRAAGAAAFRDSAGFPIHGFVARDPGWVVVSARRDLLVAERRWDAHGLRWPAFPVAHITRVTVGLSTSALTIATMLIALGDQPVPAAFGWHPYLAPPDAPRAGWILTVPSAQRWELDQRGIPRRLLPARSAERRRLDGYDYDDGFLVDPAARTSVTTTEWMLTVRFEAGYRWLQLYAPHHRDVVCIEPMAAPTNALVSKTYLQYARPDAPFEARFSLGVQRRA
jgi:aldose 1-epimerase